MSITLHFALTLTCFLAVVVDAASSNCSHGRVYEADRSLGVKATCECYQCFAGPSCAVPEPNCTVFAGVAQISFASEWFQQHEQEASANIPSAYRLDYDCQSLITNECTSTLARAVNKSLRRLHLQVANVASSVLDSHTLLIGAGATQLIYAAIESMVDLHQNQTGKSNVTVFTKPPFWPEFRNAESDTRVHFTIDGSSTLDPEHTIEIITTPNNPDMRWRSNATRARYRFYDMVYNWPSLRHPTTIRPEQQDVMIFSLSKMAGFAATRFGWAWVKDPDLAQRMHEHTFQTGQGTSVEAQFHATRIINTMVDSVNNDKGPDFWSWMRKQLDNRWNFLTDLFHDHRNRGFSLDGEPGGMFGWISCPLPEITGAARCVDAFLEGLVEPDSGKGFGGDDHHVRLCIGVDASSWDLLQQRLPRIILNMSVSI